MRSSREAQPRTAALGRFSFATAGAPAMLALSALVLWLVPGLFGRDPWKPDEAYTLGLVRHVMASGDWVVPTLAGEPFMEKPPLYFISAALFAQAFGFLLPLHDAARLATAFYVGMTLTFVALAARRLQGGEAAAAAPLLLAAALGYLQPAHLLLTDNALLAGIAMALYGLAIAPERVVAGGVLTGLGAGVAFLCKGLLGPGLVALTALALPLAPAWRTQGYARAAALAALVFAPFALAWPWLLYVRSPRLFAEWLLVNNLGRFTGAVQLGPERDHLMYLKIAPWFALPALPLVAVRIWQALRRGAPLLEERALALPLIALAVMLVVLSAAGSQRYLYALPMLLPLALAGAGVEAPPRLQAVLAGAPVALALAATLALWGGWWIVLHHAPAPIAEWLLAARPGYVPEADSALTAAAVLLTITAWLLIAVRPGALEIPLKWLSATALAWGLLHTLWLPYLDYGNSYRGVVLEMAAHLPERRGCIAGRGLGEPQRAMLEYFAGIVTRAEGGDEARGCNLLLVQVDHSAAPPPVDRRWQRVWDGARAGDANEHYWLFQRYVTASQ